MARMLTRGAPGCITSGTCGDLHSPCKVTVALSRSQRLTGRGLQMGASLTKPGAPTAVLCSMHGCGHPPVHRVLIEAISPQDHLVALSWAIFQGRCTQLVAIPIRSGAWVSPQPGPGLRGSSACRLGSCKTTTRQTDMVTPCRPVVATSSPESCGYCASVASRAPGYTLTDAGKTAWPPRRVECDASCNQDQGNGHGKQEPLPARKGKPCFPPASAWSPLFRVARTRGCRLTRAIVSRCVF